MVQLMTADSYWYDLYSGWEGCSNLDAGEQEEMAYSLGELSEEAGAQLGELRRWAEPLGLCMLQAQQLEYALLEACIDIERPGLSGYGRSPDATEYPTRLDRRTAGALWKLIEQTHSVDARRSAVVRRGVEIRNVLVHGELTIGVAQQFPPASPFEAIGVDFWESSRGMIWWLSDSMQPSRGATEVTLGDWLQALVAATQAVVELRFEHHTARGWPFTPSRRRRRVAPERSHPPLDIWEDDIASDGAVEGAGDVRGEADTSDDVTGHP
jgi:hypothetical protein